MKHKLFPGAAVFALIWAFALLLPPVREVTRSLALFRNSGIPNPAPVQRLPADNPITIEWNLDSDPDQGVNASAPALETLDKLAARFPDQLWIRASRLRRSMELVPKTDMENASLSGTSRAKLDERALNRALQIAQDAERREPKNAFWPWMEAIFHFSLRHKDAGLAAMERAGSAPRFDDYNQSTLRARLALWQKYDSPTWLEKVAVYAGTLWPHLGPMRAVCRDASAEALAARKRGDNAGALRIGSALLRATQVWRRDSDALIGSLVAESSGAGALQKLFDVRPPKSSEQPDERLKRRRELQTKWTRFARNNGRPDLAARADWLREPPVGQEAGLFLGQDLWAEFGLPASRGAVAIAAPFLLFGLGAFCLAQALAWLIGTLLSLRAPGNAPPSRGQVVACANFGFWALAGALAVGIKGTQVGWRFMLSPLFFGTPDESAPLLVLFGGAFVVGCWLLPVSFLNWKRDRRLRLVRAERAARPLPRGFGLARVVVWLAFGAFAVAVASNGRGLWDNTPFELDISVFVSLVALLGALVLEGVRFKNTGRAWPRLRLEGEVPPAFRAPRALRLARFGSWLVAVVSFGFVLGDYGAGSDLSPLFAFSVTLVGLFALALAIRSSRKIGRGDGFGFRLATRTAGVLSVAWSLVFLGLALYVWPLRNELNHQLDRRLAMRETDWMKEQLQKYPPDTPAR